MTRQNESGISTAPPGTAGQGFPASNSRRPWLRFDRHELAGAFGDIGTDLPLLLALIVTCGLDSASVLISFGALQIATGLLYGIPMPVQPLKAMAAIMLAQRLAPGVLAGGGLVIGAAMIFLAVTGLLDWLVRVVPKEVVRGIQLGLGMTLATLALRDYAGSDGLAGYALVILAVAALLLLQRQRRVPAPLVVIALGFLYAGFLKLDGLDITATFGFSLPKFSAPTGSDLVQGALLLALPQIPLSLGNSVIATSQATKDLFPERSVGVRKIGITYGLMNLIAPWFGGVPACHGCGGLVGFYAFGGRTGGAPVLYGGMYLAAGLFLAPGFTRLAQAFPMPVLGIVLLFEAVALMTLVRDVSADRSRLWIAFAVAAAVVGLPYGYVVGLVGGTLTAAALRRGWVQMPVIGGGTTEGARE
jgi:MFS superfamily sulfate permease-like transporter